MNAARKYNQASDARNLVYGMGVTGLSIARFLRDADANALFVDSRERPPGLDELMKLQPHAEVACGTPSPALLAGVTRLIVSPGISDRDPLLLAARAAGIEIASDIDLFVENAHAPFIAVTGSNGKSTVTTLLTLMCEAGGKTALAGANLGEPALDLLRHAVPDFYVLELSSFQLQRARRLPASVAVLLNVSLDHLDWHHDAAEYRAAKQRVYRDATAAVWNRDEAGAASALRDGQRNVSFGLDTPQDGTFGIIDDGKRQFLAKGTQALLACDKIAMVGRHNRANALAAMAAGDMLGLDTAAISGVLRSFPGLPHRMQFVASHDGVRYINDSKATNVAAAIASITSVESPVVLIAGGQGKGGDFTALASAAAEQLRAVVLIGADAALLEEAFRGKVPTVRADSLRAAVKCAANTARQGDTVLLAPACASLDQFDNYMQRGDSFCAAVAELSR